MLEFLIWCLFSFLDLKQKFYSCLKIAPDFTTYSEWSYLFVYTILGDQHKFRVDKYVSIITTPFNLAIHNLNLGYVFGFGPSSQYQWAGAADLATARPMFWLR